jgi:proteasome lid subunit RPN8/RPN11
MQVMATDRLRIRARKLEAMPFKLTEAFVRQIVDQAKAEHPNEACGILAGRASPNGAAATRNFPMTNAERSPVIYRIDPKEQFRVFKEIEDEGLDLVAIYHSHTRSPAYPSNTDVAQAYYPEAVYLIVSLANPEAPDLRGFRITDGKVTEAQLEIT